MSNVNHLKGKGLQKYGILKLNKKNFLCTVHIYIYIYIMECVVMRSQLQLPLYVPFCTVSSM